MTPAGCVPEYQYTVVYANDTTLKGQDTSGQWADAAELAANLIDRPHPKPLLEVRVWAGSDCDREPDAAGRRHVRQRAVAS